MNIPLSVLANAVAALASAMDEPSAKHYRQYLDAWGQLKAYTDAALAKMEVEVTP